MQSHRQRVHGLVCLANLLIEGIAIHKAHLLHPLPQPEQIADGRVKPPMNFACERLILPAIGSPPTFHDTEMWPALRMLQLQDAAVARGTPIIPGLTQAKGVASMKLETWTLTVRVTVDLDAIGTRTPQDVAEAIDSLVSEFEGVANVEFPGAIECAAASP